MLVCIFCLGVITWNIWLLPSCKINIIVFLVKRYVTRVQKDQSETIVRSRTAQLHLNKLIFASKQQALSNILFSTVIAFLFSFLSLHCACKENLLQRFSSVQVKTVLMNFECKHFGLEKSSVNASISTRGKIQAVTPRLLIQCVVHCG